MLSVSDYGLGNLIQEDIQANMSKMLNVPLWALSLSEADLPSGESEFAVLRVRTVSKN